MKRGNSTAGIDRLHLTVGDLPTVTLGGTEDPAPVAKNGKPKTSRYLGVSRRSQARARPWMAQIVREKGQHAAIIGYFADEEEAARARDREAIRLGMPTSQLNFPVEARPPTPEPTPPASSSLGREIEAMRAVATALAGIDGAACRRILEYVGRHLSGGD